jgi:hypothetical protein
VQGCHPVWNVAHDAWWVLFALITQCLRLSSSLLQMSQSSVRKRILPRSCYYVHLHWTSSTSISIVATSPQLVVSILTGLSIVQNVFRDPIENSKFLASLLHYECSSSLPHGTKRNLSKRNHWFRNKRRLLLSISLPPNHDRR